MIAQVENLSVGYVVSVYFQLPGDTMPHWYRVKNFGDRQGDAFDMVHYDIHDMDDARIISLIRSYDPSRTYIRLRAGQYHINGTI